MGETIRSGLDLSQRKVAVRPQDDLYRYMNGQWLDSVDIPADRASYGTFYILFEEAERAVRKIIENPPKTPIGQKIGDLYASFMDTAKINSLGVTPIKADIERAVSFTSMEEFFAHLGELESRGLGGLFYQYINNDAMDSTRYITHIGQSGLSLPDESYYREEQFAPIRLAWKEHIVRMLELAGVSDAQKHAERVVALETAIASHHWDQVRNRDAELTYNKMTFAELQSSAPHFPWKMWMEACKAPDILLDQSIVGQPSFFVGLNELLAERPLADWSSWLTWHLISAAAPSLSDDFVQTNFDFYGTVLSGTPQLRERWKRGVSLVEGSLGEAIGQVYVEQHFPPRAKDRMRELVDNLIEAYRIDIAALPWMSIETKTKALEKLSKFTPKIGYPDKWRDYSTLEISPDDLMGNLSRIARFHQDYEYNKLGTPVDRFEWFMTPQTVNAYYNPGMNEIVFPAAILQPPFFDLDGDDAANYGGIGAVIGHEIGHGFDDQGSKYDGDGNLHNWWSDSDREEFEKRASMLIAQYDQLSPEGAEDVHVNGALTIGENIGDLGGLTIAYKAYQLALDGKEPPVIDGLTGYQRFFLGWAQCWRGKMRPEEARRRISTDPHSPDEFRCNQVVKNLDEFYHAFNVSKGDLLYLESDQRVRIW